MCLCFVCVYVCEFRFMCVPIDLGCVQEYKETPESEGSTAAPRQPINCSVSVNITHTCTRARSHTHTQHHSTLLLNLLPWIPDTGSQEGAVFQLKL